MLCANVRAVCASCLSESTSIAIGATSSVLIQYAPASCVILMTRGEPGRRIVTCPRARVAFTSGDGSQAVVAGRMGRKAPRDRPGEQLEEILRDSLQNAPKPIEKCGFQANQTSDQ